MISSTASRTSPQRRRADRAATWAVVHLSSRRITIVPGSARTRWYTLTVPHRKSPAWRRRQRSSTSRHLCEARKPAADLRWQVLDDAAGNVLGVGRAHTHRGRGRAIDAGRTLSSGRIGSPTDGSARAAARTRSTSTCCRRSSPSAAPSRGLLPSARARAAPGPVARRGLVSHISQGGPPRSIHRRGSGQLHRSPGSAADGRVTARATTAPIDP
jgi:hypothetical protein